MDATADRIAIKTAPPSEVEFEANGKGVDLIDVRTPVEFEEVHAVGARLIPLDQLDPEAVLRSRQAPEKPIYLICKSGIRATKACERFAAAGFTNVVCVEGGTAAWERAGLPVVRGRKVISLERQVRIAAGLLVLTGVLLGASVSPWFYTLSGFVGAGLVFAGITDTCPMGLLLAKCPWNQSAVCQLSK